MLTPPAVRGQTLRIIKVYLQDYAWLEGAEFALLSNTANGIVYVPGQGFISCIEWEIIPPEEPSPLDMATELTMLRIDLATAIRDRDLMHKQRDERQDDLDKIAKALQQEAEDRQWCDEYTEFVSDLNTRLTSFQFELPTVEYEVQLQRVRTVYEQVSVTVTLPRGASTSEIHSAAIEEAWNAYDWDSYDDEVSDDYDIVDVTEL